MSLDYEIIKSGSSGNCVIVGKVMIDCGIGYKDIKEKLYSIKYLLLTHIHSDHIKMTTLATIKKKFPKITIIGNYEVHMKYKVDIISNEGYPIETDDFTFIPFDCPHNCKVHGFTWMDKDKSIIYATDCADLKGAPPWKFDYLFLESNHDKDKLEKARGGRYGYDSYKSGMRHLSTQASKAFYYLHRRDKKAIWVELHQSNRFY